MSYLELLGRVAPETIVAITALVVIAVDLIVMREEPMRNRFWVCAGFAIIGCVIAALWLSVLEAPRVSASTPQSLVGLMFMDDLITRLVKTALLTLTICSIILSLGAKFTEHVGEYLGLILFATVGMMLLVSSTDLLMIFISLELTSLSLYILTAFNKQNVKSSEAALKYFLFGGMSAAFTLFGLSLVYGLSGSTNLAQIAAALAPANGHPLDPLLIIAIVMTVIGFGFKIAAVPFHLWAPDAYEGAPTPSAALIASGSKLASFFIFAKVMMLAFAHAGGSGAWHQYASGWLPALAILAALSMILGNLAAIVQKNVKRLLAYSAIAQAGYALTGLLANDSQGMSSLIFYMITYGLTVVGAFAVVSVAEQGSEAQITSFAGLGRRAPLVSFCMMIFMLSLAGIPPLAGFFGKFYLFAAAIGGTSGLGLLWLVILAIAMSAVSLYYYLQILKQIYVVPAPNDAPKILVPISTQVILVLLAIGVVALGCAPNLLLGRLLVAMQASGM
ncbi:MAG TPA: NADH-quinone oxidoreductase subunit N [Verrucomicrobiae bacterium]|nr:NADH-quinone oxidoreductase subunit N [Verrucomicrobiae bacterium]